MRWYNKNKIQGTNHWVVVLTAALLIMLGAASPAWAAADAASFYKGKTVRIVVGFNPGGGYDEYARMIAPKLGERLGATVIIENQPGGGGLLALNRLTQGRADGLTLMLVSAESAALAQLTDRPGTRFDLTKLTWLGRAVVDTRIAMWSAQNPERAFDEVLQTMRTKGARWGGTGLTDSVSDITAAMGEALDLTGDQMSIVLGYDGTSAIALAAVRGEVDGVVVSATSAINYAGDDSTIPLVVLGRERDPLFPETPTIFEVVELSEKGQWWIDFRANVTGLGRALVTQEDVPEDRAKYLKEQVRLVLTDPALIAEAEATKRPINYLSADKQKELITSVFSGLTEERKEEITHVFTEKYVR